MPEVCLLALLGGSGGSIDAAVPYSSSTLRMMASTLSRSFREGPSAAGAGTGSLAAASAAASVSCDPCLSFPAECTQQDLGALTRLPPDVQVVTRTPTNQGHIGGRGTPDMSGSRSGCILPSAARMACRHRPMRLLTAACSVGAW